MPWPSLKRSPGTAAWRATTSGASAANIGLWAIAAKDPAGAARVHGRTSRTRQPSGHPAERNFHGENPPPAAAPRTMAASRLTTLRPIHEDRAETSGGSELSRQIAVDLEADADFDEGRSCPRHGRSLPGRSLGRPHSTKDGLA